MTDQPHPEAETKGKRGGKLPMGNLAVRSPDLNFSAASWKAATNQP